MTRRGVRVLAALLACPLVASAQDPVLPPADTLATDSTAADSSSTERLLAVQGQHLVRMNTAPRLTWNDLLPPGSRIVLTRDSLDWSVARTVGDLLAAHAPTYLWRGGWLGRTEMPNLLGRGAGAMEYQLDGIPWIPIGDDSTAVDPSLWSVDLFERIEVEEFPGRLRVSLFTRAHDRQAPRTAIAVSTGDRGLARYAGTFERRYGSGIGLGLAADYFGVNAPAGGTGASEAINGWAQLSWVPSQRFAVQLQYLAQDVDRDPLEDEGGALLDPGLDGRRSDLSLRLAWTPSASERAPRFQAWAARTQWQGEELEHDVGLFGVQASLRRPTWSAELRAAHATEWTPVDARLALGWSPTRATSIAVEGVHQKHEGERWSQYATARAGLVMPRGQRVPFIGLRVPIGVRLGAMASYGERVDAPQLEDLAAQSFADYEFSAGLDAGRLLQAEARLRSLDVWQPLAFRQFVNVGSFARQPRTEWLLLKAELRPTSWFTIASHYEHPLGDFLADGVPPHHAWSTATVNSRFLKNFPSGIFRLKVQGVLETWSPGVIGRDAEGNPIDLPGLTFVRGILQLQIGPFIAFWDRVNFQATDQGHVPGYPILSLGQSYGIRWDFRY